RIADCLPRRHSDVQRRALRGEIDLELLPQGIFVERIRAGGAGIGGSFLPVAPGTAVADGRELRVFGGRPHVFAPALAADYALVKGFRGDAAGNLTYRKT